MIDEEGDIYSLIYNRYLSCKIDKDGYKDLCLVCEDSIRRHFRIHRLVAATFLDNPDDLPIVMHLDNDKQNNHFSNLKWGTVAENTQQAYDDGCCSCNKKVFMYDRETKEFICEFMSISELTRYFGLSIGCVESLSKVASGLKKQPKKGKLKNYIITYEEKYNIKINI